MNTTRKLKCLALLLSAACITAVAAPPEALDTLGAALPSTVDGTAARRAAAIEKILAKWTPHVVEAYRADGATWQSSMASTFEAASVETLERAAGSRTFDAMNNALLSTGLGKALGDIDKDLVYVPITPCRIVDTRVAGGAIAANSVRGFDVTAVSNYSFQGGDATNCGGAGAAGSFAAAAFNFTVVTPSGNGYITAFPFLATQPLASTLNYQAGDVKGNFAVVRLDQGASANELSVYSFAQTHLVVDMVGYFTTTVTPKLECLNSGDTISTVAAGATNNTTAPACPATYVQTGTNCESSTWQMPFVYVSDGICSAQNNSAGSAQLRASRTCCRVP